MANFTITAANVQFTSTSRLTLVAGEAITAGQVICKKSDGKAYLAQCDATAEEAVVEGVAINNAAAGQPVNYRNDGALTTGSAFGAAGKLLLLSATAGSMMPAADLATGNRLSVVGYSTAAGTMNIDITNTGQVAP